ncbi:MAG TPA: hypothetical protein VG407_06280 [Caulobacteraceae bacterium]|nr:hypothetical protein [Caulobacteraceae bacterium]
MKGLRRVAIGAVLAAITAGAAQAKERYFTYEPDSASAKYRSDVITLTVREDMLGRRVEKLYRTRGKWLTLGKPQGAFSGGQLVKLLKSNDDDTRGIQLYAVDVKDGQGFAYGACKGADRAWLAITPVRPDRDLTIYVLKVDPETKGPALCETLQYRWRAEWQLPKTANEAKSAGHEDDGAPSSPR